MSSILDAIYDDIEEYKALCEKYGEEPVEDSQGINPYTKKQ